MDKIDPTRTITNCEPTAAPPRANRLARYWLMTLGGLCLVMAGCAASATILPPPPPPGTPVAPAPPPPAPYNGPTLANCLGIPQCAAATQVCAEKACTCLKRQFPGAGAAAPNLGEVGPGAAPAVKCAAEIIAAEAAAPQKIDALRYLGRIGCTKCYPCVEEGLIAALDDCTEVVRYEAAKAIRATATEQCKCCQCTSCCTQKIYDKLYKVAYDTDSRGCPVECSSRVRRVARQALCMCGGPNAPAEPEEPTPTEGPSGAPPAAPAAAAASVPPPAPLPAAAAAPPVATAAAPTDKPSETTPATTAPVSEKLATPAQPEAPATAESATPAAKSTPDPEATNANTADPKTSAAYTAAPSTTGPILKIATEASSPTSTTPTPVATSVRLVEPATAAECKACGKDASPAPSPALRFRYSWQSSNGLE